jgi:type IV pilus assembly protein PilM
MAGLVIEPGFVAAASVDVNGHIALDQAATRSLDADIVKDGEVVDAVALAATLREMWKDSGLPKHVRIGVANARIVVRMLDLPPVEDDKALEAAVRFQAGQELPIPLDQAVLDFQKIGLVETEEGTRLRCLVVVARRELIAGLVAAVRAAGLKPEGIDLSAFGMIRALDEGDEPKLFLTIGGLTNMAVTVDGVCIFTRVTGTSLEDIAETLASRCGIPLDEARGWLREAGTKGRGLAAPEVPKAIAPARAPVAPEPAPAPEPAASTASTLDLDDLENMDFVVKPAGLDPVADEDDLEPPTAVTEIADPADDLELDLVIEPAPVAAPAAELDEEPEEGSPLLHARGALLEGIRQIAGEIRSTLDFFHAQTDSTPVVASGVLTGPAAAIPGFADALSAELGLDVVARAVDSDGSLGSVDPYEVTVAAGLAVEEAPR